MDNMYILDKVEKAFPDKLPLGKVSEYELGTLIGQQDVVRFIKRLLRAEQEKEQEIK